MTGRILEDRDGLFVPLKAEQAIAELIEVGGGGIALDGVSEGYESAFQFAHPGLAVAQVFPDGGFVFPEKEGLLQMGNGFLVAMGVQKDGAEAYVGLVLVWVGYDLGIQHLLEDEDGLVDASVRVMDLG